MSFFASSLALRCIFGKLAGYFIRYLRIVGSSDAGGATTLKVRMMSSDMSGWNSATFYVKEGQAEKRIDEHPCFFLVFGMK